MTWIRNNKFLAGFIAVMAVGIGALGFLLSQSMGKYEEVAQNYETQVAELRRLQALKPFPDQTNLTKYEEVRNTYKQSVDDLQAKLASFEPPPEKPPLTPTQFQDRLRRVVDDVTKSAQAAGVGCPVDFYLGFERYRNALPDVGATALLASQLDNVQELVSVLIRQRVDKINDIKRAILPQENGAAVDPAPALRGAKGPAAAGSAELVAKSPVILQFTASPSAFRASLNEIVQSKRLFVIRALQIKNLADKGPVRGQEPPPGGLGTPGAPTPDPATAATPGEPLPEKGPPPLRYVLGQEKLDVTERVELTKVAPRS